MGWPARAGQIADALTPRFTRLAMSGRWRLRAPSEKVGDRSIEASDFAPRASAGHFGDIVGGPPAVVGDRGHGRRIAGDRRCRIRDRLHRARDLLGRQRLLLGGGRNRRGDFHHFRSRLPISSIECRPRSDFAWMSAICVLIFSVASAVCAASVLHLGGDHAESAAMFAGADGLDIGVQGEGARLARNAGDQIDHRGDFMDGGGQLRSSRRRRAADCCCAERDTSRARRVCAAISLAEAVSCSEADETVETLAEVSAACCVMAPERSCVSATADVHGLGRAIEHLDLTRQDAGDGAHRALELADHLRKAAQPVREWWRRPRSSCARRARRSRQDRVRRSGDGIRRRARRPSVAVASRTKASTRSSARFRSSVSAQHFAAIAREDEARLQIALGGGRQHGADRLERGRAMPQADQRQDRAQRLAPANRPAQSHSPDSTEKSAPADGQAGGSARRAP